MTPANFDGVARAYRWLEYATFGRALERTRFAHVDYLAGRRDILLLGDGDGRMLKRILAACPASHIVSVDASRAMLRLAEGRVLPSDRNRVTFIHADARRLPLDQASYDAVVTQFFLDCFTPDEVRAIVEAIARAVRSRGLWLFADFSLPERGLSRPAARLLTSGLYRFFRWQTHISGRALPPAECEIQRAGFSRLDVTTFRARLLRSVVFEKCV